MLDILTVIDKIILYFVSMLQEGGHPPPSRARNWAFV